MNDNQDQLRHNAESDRGCSWCPPGCKSCVGDRDCECYTHQDEPDKHLPEALVDEALAEMGRRARADEACSICHASVRPDRRDRHLDWHASLTRSVERERLPQVFGTRPGGSDD